MKGNDQSETNTIKSHPQNKMGKKHTHKLTNTTEDMHGKLNEQLFPKQVVIQLP